MKNIPTLKVTNNYSLFKKIDSNRDINKLHLKKLISSITAKNMLYLFPVIINKNNEVIDGQHRIEAARVLGLDIFYIVDNTITKADIAMMNSNRRGWHIKDYIYFHAQEGSGDYKSLHKLLADYPKLQVMSAVRLMDGKINAYYSGGDLTNTIRAGKISSANIFLAKIVCDLAQQLFLKNIQYAFSGYFLLDIKNAIIQSGMLGQQAADIILKEYRQFPLMESIFTAQQQLRRLKDILGIKQLRPYSSEREVADYLERESVKRK